MLVPTHSDDRYSLYAFGGLLEVGRNCFGFFDPRTQETLLVDAGLKIPQGQEDAMVDQKTYEETFLPQIEMIKALASQGKMHFTATHGHLDHIGGYPALFQALETEEPIVCSPMTYEILLRKFESAGISAPEFVLLAGSPAPLYLHQLSLGAFDCKFFAVPHSIPQTRSLVININGAKILFMSDFKFSDCFAYPGLTQKLEEFLRSEAPFDLVVYESLYQNRPGTSPSEDSIREPIRKVLQTAPAHIIGTWFASNIIRYMMVEEECTNAGFLMGSAGRTMREMVKIALKREWIPQERNTTGRARIFVASTGNQGEGMFSNDPSEMSALVRAAKNMETTDLTLLPDDSVAFLTDPIPGNEPNMRTLINELLDNRCPDGLVFITPETQNALGLSGIERVVAVPGLHISGHGFQEDHQRLLDITQPKKAIPYHIPNDQIDQQYGSL